jgi:hypothetical protein
MVHASCFELVVFKKPFLLLAKLGLLLMLMSLVKEESRGLLNLMRRIVVEVGTRRILRESVFSSDRLLGGFASVLICFAEYQLRMLSSQS